jgi:hypothetical protein
VRIVDGPEKIELTGTGCFSAGLGVSEGNKVEILYAFVGKPSGKSGFGESRFARHGNRAHVGELLNSGCL